VAQIDVSCHAVTTVSCNVCLLSFKSALSCVDLSLALGERVAAGRVRVNPRGLLLKMSKLQNVDKGASQGTNAQNQEILLQRDD